MQNDAAYMPRAECLGCGYLIDLDGEPRCSECGQTFDPRDAMTYQLCGGTLPRPILVESFTRPPGGWWFMFLPLAVLLIIIPIVSAIPGMELLAALVGFGGAGTMIWACRKVGAWRAWIRDADCRQGLRGRPRFNIDYVVTILGVLANMIIIVVIFSIVDSFMS